MAFCRYDRRLREVVWAVLMGLYPLLPLRGEVLSAPSDTTGEHRFRDAFSKGSFGGQFRSYFMATDNTGALSDYYAWAAGGWLHFHTAAWRGFSLGASGAFNFNLLSSDLGRPDLATGAVNRYEIGLFDVENPYNRRDLHRLEELWLRYQWRKSHLTIGQQLLQSPFINHQDGRMRPTAESGVWLTWKEWSGIQIEGGWLWRISPRSTVRWYSVGESIGLYPRGLNPDGTASGYAGNLNSRGIGLLGVTFSRVEHLKLQLWNQYVENIFNTLFFQADYKRPLKGTHRLLLGLQLGLQHPVKHGGNEAPAKTYFPSGSRAGILSTQVGWQKNSWQLLAAYTRVAAWGRFLSPREWGREPFYTFMPRERIEGSGDSHSLTGRIRWASNNGRWKVETAYGYFMLPDVRRTDMNKYGFPAFQQVNLDIRYAFGGEWEGLQAQFLYVWKGRIGDFYGNYRYVINKVDMSLVNVIFNYSF